MFFLFFFARTTHSCSLSLNSYSTNRAASYTALKRFRPALEDCQVAASAGHFSSFLTFIKNPLPPSKCQLALGSFTPALSTIRSVLASALERSEERRVGKECSS